MELSFSLLETKIIMETSEPAHQLSALLSCQIDAMSQDLEWTLANFPFVAEATALANECDLVCSPTMSVASYHGLALPKLAFLGESPELLANYATFLIEPGSEVTLLVTREQRDIVERAFPVLEIIPERQMLFAGDAEALEIGTAAPLNAKHLQAMQALAHLTALKPLAKDPLAPGPAFGVWEGRTLAAMATTHVNIPSVAEIGDIATHPDYSHRSYTEHVIGALIRAHEEEGKRAFIMVDESNHEAIQRYEKMGFEHKRLMYRMRCRVEETVAENQ
jgi:ribosomal protein S18 acetylase RimI-like enzyme